MKLELKQKLAQKRRWRIRRKVRGTPERPRLTVRFTHQHIHAQVIDDTTGTTLAGISTVSVGYRDAGIRPNVDGASKFGAEVAARARAAGIESVVFDRAGRRYHGVVKAFADAAREGGLAF